MRRWEVSLKEWGQRASYALALIGLISLVWNGVLYFYQLTHAEVDVAVRPICERLDEATVPVERPLLSLGRPHMVGVAILNQKAAADVQVELRVPLTVHQWGAVSEGIELPVLSTYKENLPTGRIASALSLPPLPLISAYSTTYLYAIADLGPGFECSDDWFDVTAPGSNVTVLSVFLFKRGSPSFTFSTGLIFWASMALLAGVLSAGFWLAKSRARKMKLTSRS